MVNGLVPRILFMDKRIISQLNIKINRNYKTKLKNVFYFSSAENFGVSFASLACSGAFSDAFSETVFGKIAFIKAGEENKTTPKTRLIAPSIKTNEL